MSSEAVKKSIKEIRKFLKLVRSDTAFANRTRPCIEFQMKRCSAPCVRRLINLIILTSLAQNLLSRLQIRKQSKAYKQY